MWGTLLDLKQQKKQQQQLKAIKHAMPIIRWGTWYLLLAGGKPEDEENTDEEKEETPPGDVNNNTNSWDRDRWCFWIHDLLLTAFAVIKTSAQLGKNPKEHTPYHKDGKVQLKAGFDWHQLFYTLTLEECK